jgi:hypothetical protein
MTSRKIYIVQTLCIIALRRNIQSTHTQPEGGERELMPAVLTE